MNEEKLETHLSQIFENQLKKFLAKSVQQKLNFTSEHFKKFQIKKSKKKAFDSNPQLQYPELKIISDKIQEYLDQMLNNQDAHHSIKEFRLVMIEKNLQTYLNQKWQDAFYLLTPLFVTTYFLLEDTGSQVLSPELRGELLSSSGLETPKKRKDACLSYLDNILIDETVIHGGRKTSWDTVKRLTLLSHYNRYQFVIKNALDDFKKLKKQKTPSLSDTAIWERIKNTYEIPEVLIKGFSVPQSNADRALEWAREAMDIKEFSDEHLRDRILKQARNEAKLKSDEKNSVIVGYVIDEDHFDLELVTVINPKDKLQIRTLKYIAPKPEIPEAP